MAYESRSLRRQKIRYNDANDDAPLKTQFVIAGAKVNPTSAAITIYAPGGTTALVSAAAMTVSGSLMTYAVPTTTTASWPVEQGYRADISVTYSAVTYPRTLLFDVAKYPLILGVTRDQLLALESRIRGMDHAGDEDFSEIIEASRDEVQLLLETKANKDGQLQEQMILDCSRIEIPFRHLVLANIFNGKDSEARDWHMSRFEELFGSILSGIKYDTSQSGAEESEQGGGIQVVRLVM